MRTLEINGREYRITGDPSMRTVKYVNDMQIELFRKYIDDENLLGAEVDDERDLSAELMENLSVDDMQEMMWERNMQEPLQTICLGTNEEVDMTEIDEMQASDFRELKDACEEALGGSASDFLQALGLDTSSRVREIQDRLEAGERSSENDLPHSVSDLSS